MARRLLAGGRVRITDARHVSRAARTRAARTHAGTGQRIRAAENGGAGNGGLRIGAGTAAITAGHAFRPHRAQKSHLYRHGRVRTGQLLGGRRARRADVGNGTRRAGGGRGKRGSNRPACRFDAGRSPHPRHVANRIKHRPDVFRQPCVVAHAQQAYRRERAVCADGRAQSGQYRAGAVLHTQSRPFAPA